MPFVSNVEKNEVGAMSSPKIFDKKAIIKHRIRSHNSDSYTKYNFFTKLAYQSLFERLKDVSRSFELAIDYGCNQHEAEEFWPKEKVGKILYVEKHPDFISTSLNPDLIADEEFIPFQKNSVDLFVSNLHLHWINDVPGFLIQVNQCLKPGGLFLAAFFGGETLIELRSTLQQAETEVSGGASPRLSPMIDIKDAAHLLQRTGFQLPVVDKEEFTLIYDSPQDLYHDLRGMGETNAWVSRNKHFSSRKLFDRTNELYIQNHSNPDKKVSATFEILYMIGWKNED